ncbi:hypothetical protein ARMSODRAFT_1085429 [Armillaria solidipes]|uniref:Uncharacterized protein n=1 Tax=Armillaria solidipes TaxID=1076256 RepID=A0A2H3BFS8_9AGAR|nr:hypothetical protein ARMSODRAFT_1085429 [Armillaria solidipes]
MQSTSTRRFAVTQRVQVFGGRCWVIGVVVGIFSGQTTTTDYRYTVTYTSSNGMQEGVFPAEYVRPIP